MSGVARGRVALNGLLALGFIITLGGCAAFGGNVKGSFSCAAPVGICAPASTIDDRALALITGETSSASPSPAGPYQETAPRGQMRRIAAAAPASGSKVGAGRTQERVLRIVFQPYIDERGRLHEASAVHAVVQRGEWQSEAIAAATPIPDAHAATGQPSETSLAEAVDRADRSASLAGIDPNLPDPAVVAAARARRADPVGAIKADVAARLEARPVRSMPVAGGTKLIGTSTGPDTDEPPVVAAITPPKAPGPDKNGVAPIPSATVSPAAVSAQEKTRDPALAAARVKADPQYQGAAREAQRTAQDAAGSVPPKAKPKIGPTVRAASFPAAVTEDN